MEMVQEQQLQLKINFLLGYNMKIVVLWGDNIWWGHFSWWRKTIQGSSWWFLQLKIRNEFIFTVHSQTETYAEMISNIHSGKLKYATI